MSEPGTSEQEPSVQGDSPPGRTDEDAGEGTQSSHRMLGFSDALLSIIATVMILPVTHTEISPEQFDRSMQRLLATRIAVYLMTFLIVTGAWAAHTRLFQVVGKIDDTLALLNLACMMTITFLPYTFSLMVTFPNVALGIFLFCVCVITIGVVQALIVGYAFYFPHLLSPQIQCSAHRALCRRQVLRIILRGPVLCLLAAVFSLFFFPAAARSPRLTLSSSSPWTCMSPSARSGWKPSATASTPSWPPSSSWTSVQTASRTPRPWLRTSAAACWLRWAPAGRASWPTSAPSPPWACSGSPTTRCSCTCARPRVPWGCSTRSRWPSWVACPWPTSRPPPSPGSRVTSWSACASAAPSSSWPASSRSPSGRRPCCARQRRCGRPCASGARSTRSCWPSWRCTPAPACWPSRPPAC
ncbi:endosomal/lysosomal proton channel TMEM175 isoform X11 [Oryctolagus cuniculus]|uniref:endosomal/lysosomal proton channel TMEM175 isoform X11 n=1 Tax=Oryctolagus cuniculus TaxID=9986 RepID=UPI003879FA41